MIPNYYVINNITLEEVEGIKDEIYYVTAVGDSDWLSPLW